MAYAAIGLSGQMAAKDGGWSCTAESDALALGAVDDLIMADTPAKLRAFAAEWFPLLEYGLPTDGNGFEETLKLASDTRDLMLLVLELRRMAEEGDCTRDAFERLGVRFEEASGGACEDATVYYLSSSRMLADYVRVTCRCVEFERFFIEQMRERDVDPKLLEEWGYLDGSGNVYCPFVGSFAPGWLIKKERLFMFGQEGLASALENDARYPAFPFATGELLVEGSCSAERALLLSDAVIKPFVQGVRMQTVKGILAPFADSRLTSLWVCLCESFREARVGACKACGLPVIAIGERGSKRQYCSDSCKRKYKRALKFASLVNEGGLDPVQAARKAGIAQATALGMLERNDIHVSLAR